MTENDQEYAGDPLLQARANWQKVLTTHDQGALEHASNTWQAVAAALKAESENDLIRQDRDTERAKFWVPSVTALIGSVALVATLAFSVYQFRITNQAQLASAEDTSFRQALQTLQDPRQQGWIVGVPLFKTFLDSPRYGDQARAVSVGFLGKTTDVDAFKSLYVPIDQETNDKNFDDLLQINRGLLKTWHQIGDEITRISKVETTMPAGPRGFPPPGMPESGFGPGPGVGEPSRLDQDKEYQGQVEAELQISATSIATYLHANSSAAHALDLSNTDLESTDLSGLDFSASKLDNALFDSAVVDGANFGGVLEEHIDGSSWDNVAWWRAASVSGPLFKYLVQYYPFSSKAAYAVKTSAAEYKSGVQRLKVAVEGQVATTH